MIFLLLAAGQASGRGDDPSTFGGIALIVGAILVAAAVVALVWYFVTRANRREEQPDSALNSDIDQGDRAGRSGS